MTTTWSPDTCGCVVEYDENHVAVASHTKCPKHAKAVDHHDHLSMLRAHNSRKNLVVAFLAQRAGVAITADGENQPHAHYDEHDVLHVRNHGVDATIKASIEQECAAKFGGPIKLLV